VYFYIPIYILVKIYTVGPVFGTGTKSREGNHPGYVGVYKGNQGKGKGLIKKDFLTEGWRI
jgi:hypothetical protein